jgi:hypothetical protein
VLGRVERIRNPMRCGGFPRRTDISSRRMAAAGLGPGRVVDRLFHDRALPEWGGLQEIDWLVVVKRVNR